MKRKSIPVIVRRAVIERDRATCQICGKVGTIVTRGGKPVVMEYRTEAGRLRDDGTESIAFHFHHLTPVFLGGSNDENNLQLRCQKCNSHEKFTNLMQNYLKTLHNPAEIVEKSVAN